MAQERERTRTRQGHRDLKEEKEKKIKDIKKRDN